jgi:Spy/CpxP family protein refolding chaperone
MMRWTSILPVAAILGGTLTLSLPAAGAPPLAAQALTGSTAGCAPPRALAVRAGFPGEMPGGPPPGPGSLPGLDMPLPPYLHELTLSDEQQDKIFDLLHAQAPQVHRLARTLHKSNAQLRELGYSEQYDEAAARGLIDAAARAQSELALLRIRADHEVLGLLTPGQRKQALADVAKHDGRERGGREHAGQDPAPSCWH